MKRGWPTKNGCKSQRVVVSAYLWDPTFGKEIEQKASASPILIVPTLMKWNRKSEMIVVGEEMVDDEEINASQFAFLS